MPRLQVYLPDDLHAAVKAHGLPASELLQEAVRAELHRRELLAATDAYLDAHAATSARAGTAERERADIIARRVGRARFGG